MQNTDWLINLTQPQATLGAAALTFVGAIVAVLLGWALFSAKVKNMQSAITATEAIVKGHQATVVQALSDIEAKISGLAASAGQLRADIVDRQAQAEEAEPTVAQSVDHQPSDLFAVAAEAWHSIRDQLEKLASDSSIDGRTAAKYQRIDRRSYADLINSMQRDGNLENAERYLEAAKLWSRYRSRRSSPTALDVARFKELAAALVPVEH